MYLLYVVIQIAWNCSREIFSDKIALTNNRKGKVVRVDLSHSGLSKMPIMTFFVREESVTLWNFLEARKKQVLVVEGAPGVGKSVEVFHHTMWRAMARQERVLYIHSVNTIGGGAHIVFKDDAASNSYRHSQEKYSKQPQYLFDFIHAQLVEETVDVLVLDGDVEWLSTEIYMMIILYPRVTLIICTSFQALIHEKSEQLEGLPSSTEILVHSWSKEDLKMAVEKKALTLTTNFNEIYYYAGGSARHMQYEVETVEKFICKKVRRCPDISLLIGNITVGDASMNAVNSLVAFHNHKPSTIVSQFATEHMLNKMGDDKAITFARTIKPDGQAFNGWLAEFEIMWLAKNKVCVTFRNEKMKLDHFIILQGYEKWKIFNSIDDITGSNKVHWWFPSKSNHPCFDAIYRVSPHHAKFIQITVAEFHSCVIDEIIPYIQAMNVHVVDFVFVCQSTNFKAFKKPTVNKTVATEALNLVYNKKLETKLRNIPQVALDLSKCCYQHNNSYSTL
jgi:hypothetical protein